MKKYEVTIKDSEIYKIEVAAENEDEARDKAWDILTENANARELYHHDSEGESEVEEVG